MRRIVVPSLVGFSCLAASVALAQTTLLNQLEQRLQNPAAGAAAPTTTTPSGGYLGAKFENDIDPTRGAKIQLVRPGTPAEGAGLKVGDYISAINGKPTLTWA